MKETLNQIKKTIIFFGYGDKNGKAQFTGTGFLLKFDNVPYIVTAKHVIDDQSKELGIIFNSKDDKIFGIKAKEIKDKYNVDWVFHQNSEVDLAVLPCHLDEDADYKTFTTEKICYINQISLLDEVFYFSFQPNVLIDNISPIVRVGHISLIQKDKTLIIDGGAFPGNSGSPVFMKPFPYYFENNSFIFQTKPYPFYFLGIVSQYIPYEDYAISVQTKQTRVMFQENTGLTVVSSSSLLDDIFKSIKFKNQHNRIK